MKKLFLIFFIFCFASLVEANTLTEARRLIQLQKQELINAQTENKKLKTSLLDAQKKLSESEVHIHELQIHADELKKWGINKQKEAFDNFKLMEEEKKLKESEIQLKQKAIKKYHVSKLINSIIASILGLVLGLYLMKFVPVTHTHYAFILPLAGIVVAFLLIWFLL